MHARELAAILEYAPCAVTSVPTPEVTALHNTPNVCLDGRLMDSCRTGVGHYSACLAGTLNHHGARIVRLDAQLPAQPRLEGQQMARALRIASAMRLHPRRTRQLSFDAVAPEREPDLLRVERLIGTDIFREARLHFRLYKRLMPIECDAAPGIMHWTYPVPLHMKGVRNVYTIHDIIPLRDIGLSPIKAAFHDKLIRRIAQRADRLLTVSETVRRHLIEMLNCSPDFVVNTSQAVQVDALGDTASPPSGDRDYFLACGSIEPRKNLERLVEAYRRSGSKRRLIITGPDGWRAEHVKRRISAVPGVELLPFQDRRSILGLIHGARALLFPSLAEGFGLPVAEAMTLGTPVMASRIETLEEVTKGAALLVNPVDVDAMGAGIKRLCNDDSLCDRLSLQGLAASIAYQPKQYYTRLQGIYADIASHSRAAFW